MPLGIPISSKSTSLAPSIIYLMPRRLSLVLVKSSTLDTAAIELRASPLKPRLSTVSKSSAVVILLVACLRKAVLISSGSIPQPLSVTRMKDIPPSLISTVTASAPASIAFSNSSLTILAGRSITSPAAILSIVSSLSSLIFAINSISRPSVIYHALKLIQGVQGIKRS